jgi:hypothetical protein
VYIWLAGLSAQYGTSRITFLECPLTFLLEHRFAPIYYLLKSRIVEVLDLPAQSDQIDSSIEERMCPAETGVRGSQRSGLRYAFPASVKVEDRNSGKHIISITSNLSSSGCHVRTSTPFQRGTKITIAIKHQGVRFQCDGEVVYAIPGAGMGIRFETEAAETDALKGWISQVSNDVIESRPYKTYAATVSVISFVVLLAIVVGALVWFSLR